MKKALDAHACAPYSPSSSPLLILNTTVLCGCLSEKYSTSARSVATPIPSSVAPGAVDTESKCAENKTASRSGSVPSTLTRTFEPSKYAWISPFPWPKVPDVIPNVTLVVRSSCTCVKEELEAMDWTRERI
jgi:hypothetical protein